MVWKGCERSVITYSSLISACEKAGHWELAMELFHEMHQEGCIPNTVTYNSLITACAQGRHPLPSVKTQMKCLSSGIRVCHVHIRIGLCDNLLDNHELHRRNAQPRICMQKC